MVKKLLRSNRGEMYIEAVVTIIIIISLLLLCISVLRVSSVKNDLDVIADQLLETAAYYGCFGTEYDAMLSSLQEKYPNLEFTTNYDGDWYNATLKQVQLGDSLSVTVRCSFSFGGFGTYLAVPLSTTRIGASENYWKIDGGFVPGVNPTDPPAEPPTEPPVDEDGNFTFDFSDLLGGSEPDTEPPVDENGNFTFDFSDLLG